MLISTYIATIPVNGDESCAAEQSRSFVLPTTAVNNAMIANVGAAARCRPFDAPRNAEPRLSSIIFFSPVER